RPASRAAVEAALATEEKALIVVAQKDASVEQPRPDDLYTIGTRVVIKKMARNENGVELLVQGQERVVLLKAEETEPFLKMRRSALPLPSEEGAETEALYRAVLDQARLVLELMQPETKVNAAQIAAQASTPLQLAYLLGSMLSLDVTKEQGILEAN